MARDPTRRPHVGRVLLAPAALDDMLQHARDEAPNECCGLLVGRRGVLERALRARNLQSSPTRYLIDPEDYFAAIRAARSEGRRVIGAYHSHPASAPAPSPSDIAEATGGPDFLYVIVSPKGARALAYCLKNGEANFLELVEAAAE